MGGFLTLITYFLIIIPPLKRVGSTLVITTISSLIAGIFGVLAGAGTLRVLESFHLESLNLFHFFFLIVLLVLLSGFFVIRRLEKISILKMAKDVNSFVYIMLTRFKR